MGKTTWTVVLAVAAVAALGSACTSTRQIQAGDVVRLVCIEPEAGRGQLVQNDEEGTFAVELMTSLDLENAEKAGTVPCGHVVRVMGVDLYGATEYDLRANVDAEIIRGWLWSITLDYVELQRVEYEE